MRTLSRLYLRVSVSETLLMGNGSSFLIHPGDALRFFPAGAFAFRQDGAPVLLKGNRRAIRLKVLVHDYAAPLQVCKPSDIYDKRAQQFEWQLGLKAGWFDAEHEEATLTIAQSSFLDVALLATVRRQRGCGECCASSSSSSQVTRHKVFVVYAMPCTNSRQVLRCASWLTRCASLRNSVTLFARAGSSRV